MASSREHIRLVVVYHHGVEVLTRSLEAALRAAKSAHRASGLLVSTTVLLNGVSNHTSAAMEMITSLQRQHGPDALRMVRNEVRTRHSNGFLARDWNTALMLAFELLTQPRCDVAVLMQHDCLLRKQFFTSSWALHKTYDFVTYGRGDELHSYTPIAVQRTGLWDERFVGLGWSEGDYFMRAIVALGPRAAISDRFHLRHFQPLSEAFLHEQCLNLNASTGFLRTTVTHSEYVDAEKRMYDQGTQYFPAMARFFQLKWGVSFNQCSSHKCPAVASCDRDSCAAQNSNPFWCEYSYSNGARCVYRRSDDGGGLGVWNESTKRWSSSWVPKPRLPYICTYPEFDVFGCHKCLSGLCPKEQLYAEVRMKRRGKSITDPELFSSTSTRDAYR